MNYFYAIILGVVQGATEFLPISSTGHLVFLHQIFKLPLKDTAAFDVMLHLASLGAVILYFKKELRQVFLDFSRRPFYNNLNFLILIGTIPAAFVGWLAEDWIEDRLRLLPVIAFMLAAIGALFLWTDKKVGQREVSDLNWRNALQIGLAQALALIPGTSRSGITIIAGLSLKMKRQEAAKFSFLLSVPIILGAVILKIPSAWQELKQGFAWEIYALAFAATFLSALFFVAFLLRFVKTHSFKFFAWYRFVLALLIMVWWLWGWR